MGDRSPRALVRALEAADLVALVTGPDILEQVCLLDGVLHSQYGCSVSRSGRLNTEVPWLTGLTDPRNCVEKECVRQRNRGWGAPMPVTWTLQLLGIHDDVRAARRHLADPAKTTVAGRRDQLVNRLSGHLDYVRNVNRQSAAPAELAAACDRTAQLVSETLAELRTARVDPAVRAKVLARAHAAMCERASKPTMRLEDTPTLAGLVGHFSTSRKVQEVIDALRVGGRDTSPLILGPRYVIDYLHRYYSVGQSSGITILTMPAHDLTSDVINAAAAIWAPDTNGPLANLADAVVAAREVVSA